MCREGRFSVASKAILGRTDNRQSNFAERIIGLSEWEYRESMCRKNKKGESEGAIKGTRLLMERVF
jgi:hypothetical protein